MIYLDNNATTQPTSRVVEAMLPYLTECYFNASASTAAFTGADKPQGEAACAMAKLLNAEEPDCFTFTSGATESNNWVCSSIARSRKAGRVLISAIEHASVAEPAAEMARSGFEIVEIPVDSNGLIQIDALRAALLDDTILVSIMAANNETGVLQPMGDIGRLIRERCPAAVFHTDATQAIGKIPIDLQSDWQDIDLLSFSAHKFHGPKGIGGLYIRPGLELDPLVLGGGQQHGLRSGTINTPALAGLAIAATEASDSKAKAIRDIRDSFEASLLIKFPEAIIHSRGVPRLSNTCFFSLLGWNGEDVSSLLAADGIIVGTGAACSSGAIQPSKSLRSMGVPHEVAIGGLRVTLSRMTTPQELGELLERLVQIENKN